MSNRVYVTGATGFLGRALSPILTASGFRVVTRTRQTNPRTAANFQTWDHHSPLDLQECEGVVNLAGEPIFDKRWTSKQKKALYDSRIGTTRALVDSFKSVRPKTLVSASAIGFYGEGGERELDESAAGGDDFLAHICADWEKEAARAETLGVRVVCLRIGIIIGRRGGALAKMLPPFKMGVGGPIGSGRQWMSWVHIEDVCGTIVHALKTPSLKGAVNATSPVPVRNKEFSKTLGMVLKRPAFIPTPPLALKILLGQSAEVLVASQKVKPVKALESGYRFKYDDLEEALRDASR